MPYASGAWGPDAKERSKRRLLYFHLYSKGKYLNNREKILKAYADNINGIKERQKAHYEENSEEIIRKNSEYYFSHLEKEKKHRQEYYAKHRDEIRKRQREYYLERTRKQKKTKD